MCPGFSQGAVCDGLLNASIVFGQVLLCPVTGDRLAVGSSPCPLPAPHRVPTSAEGQKLLPGDLPPPEFRGVSPHTPTLWSWQ